MTWNGSEPSIFLPFPSITTQGWKTHVGDSFVCFQFEYNIHQNDTMFLIGVIVVGNWRMLRIVIIQTNRRKHGPPTLGSYTRLPLPDKNATKMQTKRPINKLEKADILIIIWNTYPTHFKSNHGQQCITKSLLFVF